jgi:hypothetical protein
VSGSDSMVGPVLGDPVGVDCFWGGTIGQGVALVLSSNLLPHPRVQFRTKTLLYQILNKKS